MKHRLKQVRQRYGLVRDEINSWSLKQRILLLIVSLMVLIIVWYLVLMSSLLVKQHQLMTVKTAAKRELTVLKNQVVIKMQRIKKMEQQHQSLKMNIEQLDRKIEQSGSMISSSKMASRLWDMVSRNKRLKLVNLHSLPAELAMHAQQHGVNEHLYKQPVEVVFEGSYFDVLDYLKQLESLKYLIVWQSLDYTVASYPKATVTLKFYTLAKQRSKGK